MPADRVDRRWIASIPEPEDRLLAQLVLEYASSLAETGGVITDAGYDCVKRRVEVVVRYPGGTKIEINAERSE
jgi:hypothetical protein